MMLQHQPPNDWAALMDFEAQALLDLSAWQPEFAAPAPLSGMPDVPAPTAAPDFDFDLDFGEPAGLATAPAGELARRLDGVDARLRQMQEALERNLRLLESLVSRVDSMLHKMDELRTATMAGLGKVRRCVGLFTKGILAFFGDETALGDVEMGGQVDEG